MNELQLGERAPALEAWRDLTPAFDDVMRFSIMTPVFDIVAAEGAFIGVCGPVRASEPTCFAGRGRR